MNFCLKVWIIGTKICLSNSEISIGISKVSSTLAFGLISLAVDKGIKVIFQIEMMFVYQTYLWVNSGATVNISENSWSVTTVPFLFITINSCGFCSSITNSISASESNLETICLEIESCNMSFMLFKSIFLNSEISWSISWKLNF